MVLSPVPAKIDVVDDDPMVRAALTRLLIGAGHTVAAFGSADAWLVERRSAASNCIILDVAMPGLSGLALQQALAGRSEATPVIFLTGHASIAMCAQAMKCGAIDFLTKPVDAGTLLSAVTRALDQDRAARTVRAERDTTQALWATLTRREQEVMRHVMAGRLNKQISADLGVTLKTIKAHRGRGMEKMRAGSVAELVRSVERARLDQTAGR